MIFGLCGKKVEKCDSQAPEKECLVAADEDFENNGQVEDDEVKQRAQVIYQEIKNESNDEPLDRVSSVVYLSNLLRSFNSHDKQQNISAELKLVSDWLVADEDGTDQAKVWCIKKLLTATKCDNLVKEKNDNDNELIELLDEEGLKEESPYFTALSSEVAANNLLGCPQVLRELESFELSNIAQAHKDFAVGLLKSSVAGGLNGNQLYLIAQAHEDFAVGLLNNPVEWRRRQKGKQPLFHSQGIISRLDGDQLYALAQAHKDFAVELLKSSVVKKLDGDQLHFIAQAHKDFAVELLKSSVVKKLDGDQLYFIAQAYEDFAVGLLENSVVWKRSSNQLKFNPSYNACHKIIDQLQGDHLSELAKAYKDFAAKLLKHPTAEKQLSVCYLTRVAKSLCKDDVCFQSALLDLYTVIQGVLRHDQGWYNNLDIPGYNNKDIPIECLPFHLLLYGMDEEKLNDSKYKELTTRDTTSKDATLSVMKDFITTSTSTYCAGCLPWFQSSNDYLGEAKKLIRNVKRIQSKDPKMISTELKGYLIDSAKKIINKPNSNYSDKDFDDAFEKYPFLERIVYCHKKVVFELAKLKGLDECHLNHTQASSSQSCG